MLASVFLFTQALRHEATALLAAAPQMVVQRLVAGRQEQVPASYLERLGTIRGVSALRGRLWGYHYDPVLAANYTLMVPLDEAVPAGRVRIGSALARARGARIGDVLSLRGSDGQPHALRVDALLSPASALLSADLILMNEADFRAFFGIAPGMYTDLVLEVRNARELNKVAEKVLRTLPDTRPVLREEDPAHLRLAVRLARRHGAGLALRRGAGLHHLRLGQGRGPVRRGTA